ncbi:MAG: response regulator [Methylomonas sp.]|nr:response regulator [Methylomonas sp.]
MTYILVADDDTIFRTIIKRHLEQLGFEVIEEESGKRVARQIFSYRPAACVIDIFMEEKEGIETIHEITKMADKPKIIAVSSNAMYLNAVLGLGADAVLKKPITLETLKLKLNQLGISPGVRLDSPT